MPLRDHFRAPLDNVHAWDELHGMWPAMIVRQLVEVLPEPYFAAPGVHLGSLYEVDVGTYDHPHQQGVKADATPGSQVVATYAPPRPTMTVEPELPEQDVYEVRIYDDRRHRRLVAAIELVSPSNKDRPVTRGTFVSKIAGLLKEDICVSVVDVVSSRTSNLYAELLSLMQSSDPALELVPPPIYAVTARMRLERERRLMDTWYHPLVIGQRLPTLPLWLTETLAVSLDLEASYEESCRSLRIR